MKKYALNKKTIIISICCGVIIAIIGLVINAFNRQYNPNGISSLLNITIDKNQPQEYIGELDGYEIYVKNLKTDYSQVEDIRKRHEEIGNLTGDEKLSGFSKEDHIIPIITLCICFDKKKWVAPRSLFDMFGKVHPRIAEYVDDYRLNLISPDEIEGFEKFSSELGAIMEFIHISDDKEKLRDIIKATGKNSTRNMAL